MAGPERTGHAGKHTCYWCKKPLRTLKGLHSHISQSPQCRQNQQTSALAGIANASGSNATVVPATPHSGSSPSPERDEAAIINRENSEPIDNVDDRMLDSRTSTILPLLTPNLNLQPGSSESEGGHNAPPPLNPMSSKTDHFWVRQLDREDAPKIYGMTSTRWEEMRADEDPANPFAPWQSKEEYELVQWLAAAGISQAAIDEFLRMSWTHSATPLSFSSARKMYSTIETMMPRGPEWKSDTVTLVDAPDEPQQFFYRDVSECAAFLMGNPTFCEHMDFEPSEVFEFDGKTRIYNEMASGKIWNELQRDRNKVPPGTTLMSIVLASDKTHLTNFSGDQHMHAVYISLGNIHKDTRNKVSRRAWMLLAKLPTPKFSSINTKVFASNEEKDRMPGILKAQLFHACMRIVLEPLRRPSILRVVDPYGHIRQCMAFLMAWIADLEEQWLIACLTKNNCPACKAGFDCLGLNHPQAPRTASEIVAIMRQLRAAYPDDDTWQFVSHCKSYGLSGVEEPCWEGLPVDICRVICVDLLHGVHKMFTDHVAKWLTETIGEDDLDARFMAQPHHVGFRNFGGGISKISQWSGRENRDLERNILTVIAGHESVTPQIMKAVRALLDFIFKAQFPMHSDATLESMKEDLRIFWANVGAFHDNGARIIEHFNIPKLHALHHYLENIQNLGTADNYSTEIGETLHISMCKLAYQATNKKNYSEQIIRYLVRMEAVHLYKGYLAWRNDTFPDNVASDDEGDDDDHDSENADLNSASTTRTQGSQRSKEVEDEPAPAVARLLSVAGEKRASSLDIQVFVVFSRLCELTREQVELSSSAAFASHVILQLQLTANVHLVSRS